MQFRTFSTEDLNQMHQAFNQAFTGYFVDIRLPFDAFCKRLTQELNTCLKLSIGAFESDKLVGFIFTSIGEYNQKKTAYNGGTGIIPDHRGQGISKKLYQTLIPLLQQESVSQCVLEVITQNHPAINVYKQLGFKENRHFKCFRLTKAGRYTKTNLWDHLDIRINANPTWSQYKNFGDHQPSFQDCYSNMEVKSALETTVEAWIDGQLVGYVTYQKSRGRISQLAVAHQYRRNGIGKALVRYIGQETEAKGLNIINIDASASGAIKFLEHCGFENYLDQYEMVKKI